jgi:FAD:protein FMN transferase
MGMAISVDVRDEGIEADVLDAVFAWLQLVDETFSTYRDDSEVSRLGRGELALDECSQHVRAVLAMCDEVHQTSGGYFDPRAGGRGSLDPSGIVKGWAVEHASSMLVDRGATNHCINAGGDVRLRGEPEAGRQWQVGIVHPLDRRALTTVVAGRDFAVATSGTSERGLHVIDPGAGRPAADLASVTIVGPELTYTDAYATAALAMGLDAPKWLTTLPAHQAYIIDATGRVWWTDGFARYAPSLADRRSPVLAPGLA